MVETLFQNAKHLSIKHITKHSPEKFLRYREILKKRNDFTQLWRQWPCLL